MKKIWFVIYVFSRIPTAAVTNTGDLGCGRAYGIAAFDEISGDVSIKNIVQEQDL